MGAPGTTDGPWIADLHNAQRNGGRFYAAIWRPGDAVPIGAICLNVEGMPDAEGRANASQVAASPDLYDALVWLLDEAYGNVTKVELRIAGASGNVINGITKARKALAKARGE